MELTNKLLHEYFSGSKKRLSYGDSVTAYEFLRFHFDGVDRKRIAGYNTGTNNGMGSYGYREANLEMVLATLIHNRRPSETDDIWAYRKEIFECITKECTSAVLRSLTKIKRSDDWDIRYPAEEMPSNITEDETLKSYCELNFPMHYDSVTNWAFAILLKNLLIDPNAVCLVLPLNPEAEANEYLKPFPIIFNSNQVFEYKHDEFAVLLSVEKTDDGGNIFLVVTENEIQKWSQKGNTGDYIQIDTYVHGLDELPCFRLPGVYKKSFSTDVLFESHLAPIVPRLNEAVREYSDMQAEVVQHVFSEKWEMVSQKCEECFNPVLGVSTGQIKNGKKLVTCQKCNGTGTMGSAPYKKIQIRPSKIDEQQTPIPPAGYIQKQIDIVKVQDERIDAHIYKALAAINMQFLADTPLNQSGKAKEVDKDELNNFIYAIASDIIRAMNRVYYLVSEYRYKTAIPSKENRKKFLPVIPIPTRYDLLSGSYVLEDLKNAKGDAKLNTISVQAMELEYINKQEGVHYTKAAETLQLIFDLDPFPEANDDEKLARKQVGGITDLDYVISCNITQFVKRALFEDASFCDKPRNEQIAKMEEYGNEKLLMNSKMKSQVQIVDKVTAGA